MPPLQTEPTSKCICHCNGRTCPSNSSLSYAALLCAIASKLLQCQSTQPLRFSILWCSAALVMRLTILQALRPPLPAAVLLLAPVLVLSIKG